MTITRTYSSEAINTAISVGAVFSSEQDRLDQVNDLIKHRLVDLGSEDAFLPLLFPDHDPMPIKNAFIRVALLKEKDKPKDKPLGDGQSSGSFSKEESIHPSLKNSYIGEYEQIHQDKEPIALSKVFPEILPKRYHAIVQGRAGIGKTTLSKYVSYCATSGLGEETVAGFQQWARHFKGIITIPLNLLNEFHPVEQFNGLTCSVQKSWLAEFLLSHALGLMDDEHLGSNPTERAQNFIKVLHDKHSGHYLFILDGYDEISPDISNEAKSVLEQLEAFPYWLLSSRPYQVKASLIEKVKQDAKLGQGLMLELMGFVDEDIPQYIRQFYDVPEVEEGAAEVKLDERESVAQLSSNSLIAFLKNNPGLKSICTIPICLELLCFVWEEKQAELEELVEVTEPQLYYYIVAYLAARGMTKRGVAADECDDLQTFQFFKDPLIALQKLAFAKMQTKSLLIRPEDLRALTDHSTVKVDDLYEFSLLNVSREEARRREKNHYFVHLSFQEFLAACELVRQLSHDDETERAKAIDWVASNKYFLRYRPMLGFVAGLTVNTSLNAVWLGDEEKREYALNAFWQALRVSVELMGKKHTELLIDLLRNMGQHFNLIPSLFLPDENSTKNEFEYLDEYFKEAIESTFFPESNYDLFKNLRPDQFNLFFPQTADFLPDWLQLSGETDLYHNEECERDEKSRVISGIGTAAATQKMLGVVIDGLLGASAEVSQDMFSIICAFGEVAGTPQVVNHIFNILKSGRIPLHHSRHYQFIKNICSAKLSSRLIQFINESLQSEEIGKLKKLAKLIKFLGPMVATDDVIAAVASRIRDPEPLVRATIAEIVEHLGEKAATPDILAGLADGLREDVESVRLKMQGAICHWDGLRDSAMTPDISAALVDYLHDSKMGIRLRTLPGLANLQSTSLYPSLLKAVFEALLDANYLVRHYAKRAIKSYQLETIDSDCLNILREGLFHSDWEVRQLVVETVEILKHTINFDDMAEIVLAGLQDDACDIKETMAELVEVIGLKVSTPDLLSMVERGLNSSEAFEMANMTRIYAVLTPTMRKEQYDKILVNLRHGDYRVRLAMAMAVKNFGVQAATPEVLAEIAKGFQDEALEVKEAVAKVAKSLGSAANHSDILEGIALRFSDPESANLELYAEAAAAIGPGAATPQILNAGLQCIKNCFIQDRDVFFKMFQSFGAVAVTPDFLRGIISGLLDDKREVVEAMVAIVDILEESVHTSQFLNDVLENMLNDEGKFNISMLWVVNCLNIKFATSAFFGFLVEGLSSEESVVSDYSRDMISFLSKQVVADGEALEGLSELKSLVLAYSMLNEPSFFLGFDLSDLDPGGELEVFNQPLFSNSVQWLAYYQDSRFYFVNPLTEMIVSYPETECQHDAVFSVMTEQAFYDEGVDIIREIFYPDFFAKVVADDEEISLGHQRVGLFSRDEDIEECQEEEDSDSDILLRASRA